MARLRDLLRTTTAAVLSFGLITASLSNASGSRAATPAFGTVVSADRAHVGTAAASVGTTVVSGDSLDTDKFGSLQVRAGAARLMLSSASHVTWAMEDGGASATLMNGTAMFSTATAKAFTLHAVNAQIRPNSDGPTIGSVQMLGPKELAVSCTRGSLAISVDDDTKVVTEGTAYRVVLDPDDPSQTQDPNNPGPVQGRPKKSGRNRFLMYLIIFGGAAAAVGLFFAFESPDKP